MNKMVENIENMNKRTRMILSLVGISAVVVPAILLLVLSKTGKQEPKIVDSKRSVDTQNIERTVSKSPVPTIAPSPTPAQSTSSASPKAGTSSAR
ncbi:hypothetical protein HY024_01100 [Candidatus Curtissbacteria bacterium]|nr:hypothetical protein [Candidatus Curtissbacteria bacterium]